MRSLNFVAFVFVAAILRPGSLLLLGSHFCNVHVAFTSLFHVQQTWICTTWGAHFMRLDAGYPESPKPQQIEGKVSQMSEVCSA